jgi:hypothetical protein
MVRGFKRRYTRFFGRCAPSDDIFDVISGSKFKEHVKAIAKPVFFILNGVKDLNSSKIRDSSLRSE